VVRDEGRKKKRDLVRAFLHEWTKARKPLRTEVQKRRAANPASLGGDQHRENALNNNPDRLAREKELKGERRKIGEGDGLTLPCRRCPRGHKRARFIKDQSRGKMPTQKKENDRPGMAGGCPYAVTRRQRY